jgi:hypothetical protein
MKMRRKILFIAYLVALCSLPPTAAGKNQLAEPVQERVMETMIFIPTEEMKSILGIEKEGIFVPYGEYKRLYEKAKAQYTKKQEGHFTSPDGKVPVIVQATYSGFVVGQVLQFEARFQIVQDKSGPSLLDFPLKGVGFQKAKLNGEKVQIYDMEGDPRVVIPGRGPHDLALTFLVPIAFAENRGSVSFDIPPAILGHIKITSDLFYEIEFKDLVFASRRQVGDRAEFFGFIGSQDAVSLEINNRRSFGERIVKISSSEEHRVFVDREVIHREAEFNLRVQDGQAKGVEIEIGKNEYPYSVSGAAISGWARKGQGEKDVLTVSFHVPIADETQITLKTYRTLERSEKTFPLEDLFIKDLFEREGSLFLSVAHDTRVTTEDVQFLRPLDRRPLGDALPGPYTLQKGYGLINLPYRLVHSFRDVPSRTECYQFNRVSLERSRILFHSENVLEAVKPGTARFVFSLPDGYWVRDVTVFLNKEKIQTFYTQDKAKSLLTIEMVRPVGSQDDVFFVIESERFLEEELIKEGSAVIGLPHLFYTNTQRMTGTLYLTIEDVFLLEDMVMKGYTPSEQMISHSPSQSDERKTLIYDFRKLSPEGLLTVSYREGETVSTAVNYIAVNQDLLQASAYIRYEISAGSRDSFYFAVPRWEDSKIHITGADIKERKKVSPGILKKAFPTASLPNLTDHDLWNVVLQKEVTGTYLLAIDYQKKIEADGAFAGVPLVMPVGVRNDTGYIVMESSQGTEIRTKKAGLNDVETYEIPKWPPYTASRRIIESLRYFARPFTFQISVLRRDESGVLPAIAEKEDLSYSVGKDSGVFFEFDYTIRNTNLQFLQLRFPKTHSLWSATLQGEGIKPRKGTGDDLLFPLPSNEDIINLRLTGYIPETSKWSIWKSSDFSSPRLSIPSMRSRIRVFFPEDYAVLAVKGNFENLPELGGQNPLILSGLSRIFSSFVRNMKSYPVFQPLAKRRAPRIISRGAPEEESVYETREEGYVIEDKREGDDGSRIPALDPSDRSPDGTLEGVAAPSPHHFQKEGILSMNISIPKEGVLLPAGKLWGESRLRVTFLASAWREVLRVLAAIAVIALGFYLTGKRITSPFGFLILSLVLFTLLPLTVLRSLVFMFDGAVLGALLFTAFFCLSWLMKRSRGRAYGGVLFVLILLPCLLFASSGALAESRQSFPDVEVYVPYGEKVPFGIDDSHEVFIPTEDYFRLEFLANPPYRLEETFEYEKEYAITGFTVKGTAGGDRVGFTASLDVFVNQEKWALIELPFSNVFVEALTLDGREIPVRMGKGEGKNAPSFNPKMDIYEIAVLGFGHHSIDIIFHVEVEITPGKKTMAFSFPETLFTDFSLAIDDKDLHLEFDEPEDGYYIRETGKGVIAHASLSQKSFVKISWFPKKFVKKGENPLIYAVCDVNMFMGYETVLVSQTSKIRVEKSALASLVFKKHPELVITDVFSDKVKSWRTGNKKRGTVFEVFFKTEITEAVEILINGRMRVMPGKPTPALLLEPAGAERVRGSLNLYGSRDTRVLVENPTGLEKSGTGEEHRRAFSGFELQKRYSFLDPAFKADILALAKARKVYADLSGTYEISEDLLTAHFTVDLDVRESFLTSLHLKIPEGFRIGAVNGDDLSDYYLQESNVLVLPFQRAIRGNYGFNLVLEKELPDLNSLTIEGIELLDMQRVEGRLLVLFPGGIDVRETEILEIRPVDIKTGSMKNELIDETYVGARYAYAFAEKPFKATYDISKRKPSLDVVKVYHARVEDNLVHVQVLSVFTIKNASVDRFELEVPLPVKDSIEIDGEGIRNVLKKIGTEGENARITVHMVSEIERSYLMEVSYRRYIGEDGSFEMPRILFPQADNRTEFVSVETATVYHLETRPSDSLREVEPERVPAFPAGVKLNSVLWAYRVVGSGGWNYELQLKRLERENLISATILREEIKTLIIPQGYALHEIRIKANNRVLQFLPLEFPLDAELWSLRVDGEPVRGSIAETLGNGKIKSILVPLIKRGAGDRSLDIEFVYMVPISEFSWWGRIQLEMVTTGTIPVEKTTWTLFVPRSYSYRKFTTNMEEVDITVIETEKALDLAREYEYWTNMARTATGELRVKALFNRKNVMTDYIRQQGLTQRMQSDLDVRMKEEQQGSRQVLLKDAQSRNMAMLNEALTIVESNRPVSTEIGEAEEQAGKQVISGRKDIRGWQFKTRDFAGQEEVRKSLTGFFRSEDERREFQEREVVREQKARQSGGGEIAKKKDQPKSPHEIPVSGSLTPGPRPDEERERALEWAEGLADRPKPARPPTQKEALDPFASPKKRSVLLKGLRSMDVALPEQGIRFSFEKLGGNPTMTLTYLKRGILSRLVFLVVFLAASVGTLRFRKWRFPTEKIAGFFEGMRALEFYERVMHSRLVKIIPTLTMVAGFFLGLPWFVMGLGLNTALLLRYLSMKRYQKKEYIPPYNHRIFLKYLLSYIILVSAFLFIVTAFHPVFFVSLVVSTVLNGLYVAVYAVLYVFTKQKGEEKSEQKENRSTVAPLPPETGHENGGNG